jgi:hypothetical protein
LRRPEFYYDAVPRTSPRKPTATKTQLEHVKAVPSTKVKSVKSAPVDLLNGTACLDELYSAPEKPHTRASTAR